MLIYYILGVVAVLLCAIVGFVCFRLGVSHRKKIAENEIGSATTKAISSRCGHTNTKMTLHYAHIYDGTDLKIANELDELMKGRNNKCQQKTMIENSVSEA